MAYSRKTRVVYKGAEVQEVALALRGRAGGQGQREAFVGGQAGSTSATVGSPAHTVPGRLAEEHPRLTHKKDRRGRQAGPRSPIPLSSPSVTSSPLGLSQPPRALPRGWQDPAFFTDWERA